MLAEVVNSTWISTEVVLPDVASISIHHLVPDSLYVFVVQSRSCCHSTARHKEQLSEQVNARTRRE